MTRAHTSTKPPVPWERWHVAVMETGDGYPVCLSLANTRNWRRGTTPMEHLNAYSDLLYWIGKKRLLDAAGVAALAKHAVARPRLARAALEQTIALRDAVYRVFSERALSRTLPADDLALIVDGFNDAVARVELVLENKRMVPRQRDGEPGLDVARLQTALSAVALLTSDRCERVKECADDRGCGWLFVDETRNGSRRFCLSNECGNRARQAAFRHRHRTDTESRAAAPGAGRGE